MLEKTLSRKNLENRSQRFHHTYQRAHESLAFHARMIWNNENGIAPAFTVRYSHEYLLWFYKKGHMLMPCKETRGKFMTVFNEPSTKHSKKPQCAYEMLEAMFPRASRLELFARNSREGWDAWGNEIQGDTSLTFQLEDRQNLILPGNTFHSISRQVSTC
jgi:hypothetical protein